MKIKQNVQNKGKYQEKMKNEEHFRKMRKKRGGGNKVRQQYNMKVLK